MPENKRHSYEFGGYHLDGETQTLWVDEEMVALPPKAVGLLALEDPETGEIVWVDTANRSWQRSYRQRMQELAMEKTRTFRQASVDRIGVGTDQDYTAPLTAFFQERSRRIRH